MFGKKINKDYLSLVKIAYGGRFFQELENYSLKEISLENTKFKKVTDTLLSKEGIEDFYSYKNADSGFCAVAFEDKKTKNLIVVFRGTERLGLGENVSDVNTFIKDLSSDINILTNNYDEQFIDAFRFFKLVKKQNPKAKIILLGHSLGGALAQITAAKEYTINRKKTETYTYNSPGCQSFLYEYDCNLNLNYSFVTNYSVANDWCGMYGKHIVELYLINPIKLKELNNASNSDIADNVALTTHEGIFDYCIENNGKIFKKPKDYTNTEALSLWYYDNNNPLREYENFSEFLNTNFIQLDFLKPDFRNTLRENARQFIEEKLPQDLQNSNFATAVKNATDKQIDKFAESCNNNLFAVAIKTLDLIFSEVSEKNCEKAKKILRIK